MSCVWGWGHSVGMNKDRGHTGMTREEGGHTGGLSGQGLGDTLGGKGHLGVVNWKTH